MSDQKRDADTVLDLPMESNDSGADTIRGYLAALLHELWKHGEGFSSKRPFGNSDWQRELAVPLIKAGLVKGSFDEDGFLDEVDWRATDRVLADAIAAWGSPTTPSEEQTR